MLFFKLFFNFGNLVENMFFIVPRFNMKGTFLLTLEPGAKQLHELWNDLTIDGWQLVTLVSVHGRGNLAIVLLLVPKLVKFNLFHKPPCDLLFYLP